MKKTKQPNRKKRIAVDALQQINLNAAGIDIGAEEIFVALPPDRDEQSVRSFATFTVDLHKLADWLHACNIDTVAMESTGVYWIPLYEILEARGIDVNLINARHIKNVSGRKTDVLDCEWIQQLHTYGLLQPSFRPPEDICALRSLVRHREMLIHYRAAHIQHMQKALQLMNIQLSNVLSDITGVTGMQIIRAIVSGERNPVTLARFRNTRCASSEEEIAKSLEGHYKREHLFALRQALELYDFYDRQMADCDAELEMMYAQFDPPDDPTMPAPPRRTRKRRKNQPHFDLGQSLYRMVGVDLTQADGLDALSVQTILSEIGIDMDPWPTVKHFASWLRLAPNNRITGGKVKSRGTLPTQNRAATAFRVAAQSLARSNSALGAFYRRIRARHGAPKAVTATAHKLARIVYFMLKNRTSYQDPGLHDFEEKQRLRTLLSLERKAAKLGFRLEPLQSASVVVS
jgi:transposase